MNSINTSHQMQTIKFIAKAILHFSGIVSIAFLMMMAFLQCTNPGTEPKHHLEGLWGFIDVYGNYNEAVFDGTTYKTMNRFVPDAPVFNYRVKNDTLYSDVDKRRTGMNPIAAIQWLNGDKVVFTGEFVSDTLYRLKDVLIHIGTSDPIEDSINFWTAFYQRYESFLIKRGIVTEDDVRQFRESGRIPDEVLDEMTQ